jgi:hypothetical protein
MSASIPIDVRRGVDALERRQQSLESLRAMVAVAEEDAASGRIAPLDRVAIQCEVRERLAAQGCLK